MDKATEFGLTVLPKGSLWPRWAAAVAAAPAAPGPSRCLRSGGSTDAMSLICVLAYNEDVETGRPVELTTLDPCSRPRAEPGRGTWSCAILRKLVSDAEGRVSMSEEERADDPSSDAWRSGEKDLVAGGKDV